MEDNNFRLKVGVAILFFSFAIGWGGAAVCSALYLNTGNVYWVKTAGILYALSWVLFLIAFLISGRAAYQRFKSIFSKNNV